VKRLRASVSPEREIPGEVFRKRFFVCKRSSLAYSPVFRGLIKEENGSTVITVGFKSSAWRKYILPLLFVTVISWGRLLVIKIYFQTQLKAQAAEKAGEEAIEAATRVEGLLQGEGGRGRAGSYQAEDGNGGQLWGRGHRGGFTGAAYAGEKADAALPAPLVRKLLSSKEFILFVVLVIMATIMAAVALSLGLGAI
jgi:hypothetical protein